MFDFELKEPLDPQPFFIGCTLCQSSTSEQQQQAMIL
jgi:hypothetical protein